MSTPLAAFGPGILIVQRTDIAVPAPVNIGYAQEFSIDAAGSTKELYGQNQYALIAARGTVKATGKIKAAVLSGLAWNATFFGQSFASGGEAWNIDEAHTVAATSQQVTNHSGFAIDLGVRYAATNLPLQRVAPGSETAGSYSVSTGAGTYTFAAADETGLLFTYTNAVATGQTLAVNNKLIGTTPTFQLDYYTNLNQPTAKPFAVRMYACIGSKLSMASKLEDFIMPELDFSFFDNGSGKVWEMIFPEAS